MNTTLHSMVIPVMESGDTKLERFLPENQHTQRKLLNFENCCNGKLSKIGHAFSKKLMLSKKDKKMCS